MNEESESSDNTTTNTTNIHRLPYRSTSTSTTNNTSSSPSTSNCQQTQPQGQEEQKLSKKLLRWLTYSTRPLFIEELAEVFTIDASATSDESNNTSNECTAPFDSTKRPNDPREILDSFQYLGIDVTITDTGPNNNSSSYNNNHNGDQSQRSIFQRQQKQVRLVRPTSTSSTTPTTTTKQAINEESAQAHALIAEECLLYLLQFNQPYPTIPEEVQSAALLDYTTNYWAIHTRLAFNYEQISTTNSTLKKSTNNLHNLILKFFLDSEIVYKNWIAFFEGYTPFDSDNTTSSTSDNNDYASIYSPSFLYFTNTNPLPQPLYYAAFFGLTRTVLSLIVHLLNNRHDTTTTTTTPTTNTISVIDEHGGIAGSALTAACLTGHADVVKLLVEAGADIHLSGPLGSPLDLATEQGHARIVQILIESGPMEEVRQHLRRRTGGQIDVMRLLRRR